MFKKLLLVIFVLALGGLSTWYFCLPITASVELEVLNQHLAQHWPAQQKHWQLLQLSWQSPQLQSTPQNRFQIHLNGEVKLPFIKPLPGQVSVLSDLNYRYANQTFYLSNLSLESIQFAELPAGQSEHFKNMVNQNLLTQLSQIPVYQVKSGELPARVADAHLTALQLKGPLLQLTFCNPLAPQFLSASCAAQNQKTLPREITTATSASTQDPL